jgi:uncharacterized protein YdeI (YjbR/CyaY-like superfamily)
MIMTELETVLFESQDVWEQWLETHHESSPGVRLKIAKKASGKTSVSYDEALETALCFGWIDSQKQRFDDDYWLQRFTPRRPKSPWSAANREKAQNLIAQGKMREPGLREVELAKANGRWEAAYQPQGKMTVPDDLQQALDANDAARAFFEMLDSANRYAVLYRVTTAKKAETRQKRITKYVDMLARGEKIHT